jgi:hypothetical protein
MGERNDMRNITEDDINKIETIIGELKHCANFYIARKEYIQNLCCEADEWVEEMKSANKLT